MAGPWNRPGQNLEQGRGETPGLYCWLSSGPVLGVAVLPAVFGLVPGGWSSAGVEFWVALTVLHTVYAVVSRSGRGQSPATTTCKAAAHAGCGGSAGVGRCRPARRRPDHDHRMPGLASELSGLDHRQQPRGQWFVVIAMGLLLVGMLTFPSGGSAEDRSRMRLDIAIVMGGAATSGMAAHPAARRHRELAWLIVLHGRPAGPARAVPGRPGSPWSNCSWRTTCSPGRPALVHRTGRRRAGGRPGGCRRRCT